MIAQEDYSFITAYEAAKTKQERDALLESNKAQCARTMINFITTVAKDQNVRYVLTLLDDMILVSFMCFFTYMQMRNALWTSSLSLCLHACFLKSANGFEPLKSSN